jgi:hypothetical protein
MSYAKVTSALAIAIVFAAGADAAVKAPRNSVGPAQLKKNAVTHRKIANGAVNSRAAQRLTSQDIADDVSGPEGTKGPQGDPGPPILARIDYESAPYPVPDGFVGHVEVGCPNGTNIVGGGGTIGGVSSGGAAVSDAYPKSRKVWHVDALNETGTNQQMVAYAICAAAGATTP